MLVPYSSRSEVADVDGKSILKVGLIGGAGYLAYRYFFAGATTAPAASTPASSTGTAVAPTPQLNTTLDAAYSNMLVKASGHTTGSIDDWDSWLMQGTAGLVAPDPLPLFQAAIPGFDRATQITAADYWKVMAPAIKSKYGLSGLGFFGECACSTGFSGYVQ